jgi:hypothetical protein
MNYLIRAFDSAEFIFRVLVSATTIIETKNTPTMAAINVTNLPGIVRAK